MFILVGAGELLNAIGDSKRLKLYALILGIGNAADAIEVGVREMDKIIGLD